MERIVLFDGVCNFCNGAVNFIIKHDPQGTFRFAPLQSELGNAIKDQYRIPDNIDSVILVDEGRMFLHSDAALRIAEYLGPPWSFGRILVVVPAFIRNAAYRLFARYRYRIFGRRDACMLPTPEIRERFLSEPKT